MGSVHRPGLRGAVIHAPWKLREFARANERNTRPTPRLNTKWEVTSFAENVAQSALSSATGPSISPSRVSSYEQGSFVNNK
jgi:hypothetical protein